MKPLKYNPLLRLWRLLTEPLRPPEIRYFRTLENVEVVIDWGKRKMTIVGDKIEYATDEQALWIRHLARAAKDNGTVRNIEQ